LGESLFRPFSPGERRTLLDSEHLAARFAERLTALGVRQVEAFEHPAALDALAVALAAHHGHPMRQMDGEPLLRA
jgi:hypothetical protein